MNYVNWFWMEEEFCIGCTKVGNKKVFLTEEAERFEAPRIGVASTLKECVLRKWFVDSEDALDDEDKEYFNKELADITAEYERKYK